MSFWGTTLKFKINRNGDEKVLPSFSFFHFLPSLTFFPALYFFFLLLCFSSFLFSFLHLPPSSFPHRRNSGAFPVFMFFFSSSFHFFFFFYFLLPFSSSSLLGITGTVSISFISPFSFFFLLPHFLLSWTNGRGSPFFFPLSSYSCSSLPLSSSSLLPHVSSTSFFSSSLLFILSSYPLHSFSSSKLDRNRSTPLVFPSYFLSFSSLPLPLFSILSSFFLSFFPYLISRLSLSAFILSSSSFFSPSLFSYALFRLPSVGL